MGVSSTPPTPLSSWSSSSSMTSPSSPFASWSAPSSIKVSSVCLALKLYEEVDHGKKAMEVIHQWQRTCMSILIIIYSHLTCNQQQLFVVWTFLEMGILNVHTNQLQIKLFMLPHLMMFLANTASYAGGLLYFGFFFPWFFINSEYETMTQGQKFASCLPFNTAMAMGFNIIGIHEGTGWSFHNIVHILYLTICLYVKSAVNLVKMFRFFKNPTYLAEYFRRGSAVEQLPQSALCRR